MTAKQAIFRLMLGLISIFIWGLSMLSLFIGQTNPMPNIYQMSAIALNGIVWTMWTLHILQLDDKKG